MYEEYTRQSLPPKNYRELLGSAICVFNSNNSFIIENILNNDNGHYSWYDLIDRTSGRLNKPIEKNITKATDSTILICSKKMKDYAVCFIHLKEDEPCQIL